MRNGYAAALEENCKNGKSHVQRSDQSQYMRKSASAE
jgi:hypothetical protein